MNNNQKRKQWLRDMQSSPLSWQGWKVLAIVLLGFAVMFGLLSLPTIITNLIIK
jgi:hypothetical protein